MDPSAEYVEIEVQPVDARLWWLVLLAGVAAVVLGLLLLFRPFDSLVAMAWLLGLFLIVSGIAGLFAAHRKDYGAGLAVVSLVIGIVLVAWPDITVQALAVIAGIGFIARGILRSAIAFVERGESWGLLLVVGILGIGLGIAIMVWPDATVAVIGVVAGIGALITGISEIAVSLELRKHAA